MKRDGFAITRSDYCFLTASDILPHRKMARCPDKSPAISEGEASHLLRK